MITTIVGEDGEAHLVHTDHRQWVVVVVALRAIAQDHHVEALEEAGEVEEDEVDMDTAHDRTAGRGAGHHAEVLRGPRIAGLCHGHHHQGEDMAGATHRHAEADVVGEEEAAVVVEVQVAEEARVTVRMAVEVPETAVGAEIVDET
jgi:hypothetical protein